MNGLHIRVYHAHMDILLTHESALEFWQTMPELALRALDNRSKAPRSAPASIPQYAIEMLEASMSCGKTVHIAVQNKNARRNRNGLRCHIESNVFAQGTICDIPTLPGLPHSSVVAPEVCYTQIARTFDFTSQLMLGFEMCGTYRSQLNSDFEAGTALLNAPRLTTPSAIRKYALARSGPQGTRKSLPAIPYILQGAASPMEAKLAILLSLPHRYGGYGLPAPKLNHAVEVPAASRSVLGSHLRCDLCWPVLGVAVEYDSTAYHSDDAALVHDAIRYNTLQRAGLTPFIVRWGQLRSLARCDELAENIAAALRTPIRIRCADFRAKQQDLRRILSI